MATSRQRIAGALPSWAPDNVWRTRRIGGNVNGGAGAACLVWSLLRRTARRRGPVVLGSSARVGVAGDSQDRPGATNLAQTDQCIDATNRPRVGGRRIPVGRGAGVSSVWLPLRSHHRGRSPPPPWPWGSGYGGLWVGTRAGPDGDRDCRLCGGAALESRRDGRRTRLDGRERGVAADVGV